MNPDGVSPEPAATTGDLPEEEAVGAKVLPVPVRPIQQEVDLHNAHMCHFVVGVRFVSAVMLSLIPTSPSLRRERVTYLW